MKKISLLLVALVSFFSSFASLNTMSYQAVITDADGKPVSNKSVGLSFRIMAGDKVYFEESATATTSATGLVQCEIGSTTDAGITDVDWTTDNLRLVVGVDMNGGKEYKTVYSSAIQSVPTAVYALKSGDTRMLEELIQLLRADVEYKYEETLNTLNTLSEQIYIQEEKTNDLRTQIESLKQHINVVLEGDLNYMMSRIAEMDDRIQKLEAEIAELKK